jgi:hypothetical protein
MFAFVLLLLLSERRTEMDTSSKIHHGNVSKHQIPFRPKIPSVQRKQRRSREENAAEVKGQLNKFVKSLAVTRRMKEDERESIAQTHVVAGRDKKTKDEE